MHDSVRLALDWYVTSSPQTIPQQICPSRDLFQARLASLYREIIVRAAFSEDQAALFTAIVGEIGNNCFDHNLGQWKDTTGCWFSWNFLNETSTVFSVIADHGQGVLNSLKRVMPTLQSESEALKIAFEKTISGRSPEQRGNGLKFVRSVIDQDPHRGLLFYSGAASLCLGGMANLDKFIQSNKIITENPTGTLALIVWRNS